MGKDAECGNMNLVGSHLADRREKRGGEKGTTKQPGRVRRRNDIRRGKGAKGRGVDKSQKGQLKRRSKESILAREG